MGSFTPYLKALKMIEVSVSVVCGPVIGAFSQCSMFLGDADKLHNPSVLILYECGWQHHVSTPVYCGPEDSSGRHCDKWQSAACL